MDLPPTAMHGPSWAMVRRAEGAALARWSELRPAMPLRQVGVDEKWLGRRHKLEHDFVTVVSNLETGEPIWIGPGRSEETLASFLATLSPEQKAGIQLFGMDMHAAFANAVRADPALDHAAIVHDPFHVVKRAGDAVDELRREVFFRAGVDRRRIGRRWWPASTESSDAPRPVDTSHSAGSTIRSVLTATPSSPSACRCPPRRPTPRD